MKYMHLFKMACTNRLSQWQYLLFGLLLGVAGDVSAQEARSEYLIPMESNTYLTKQGAVANANANRRQVKGDKSFARVGREGLVFNIDTISVGSTFFYLKEASSPQLEILVKGSATLGVTCGSKTHSVKVDSKDDWKRIKVGRFDIPNAGYVRVDFKCTSPHPGSFVMVKKLFVSNISQEPLFIAEGFSSHFGRRGPSVHLNYRLPNKENVEWFYNEVTVPAEGDISGSYYCAQGFDGGYFGFQHNSETERRVLFSIWSPFETQDPRNIPEADRIVVLKHGNDVHVGEFGNEGSGGQTFLRYNWKAGNTYRFLLHVKPVADDKTIYTAYFYAPEENKWMLIASMSRPRTSVWVRGSYSFVENFSPNQGHVSRSAYFGNAWACTDKGVWMPITRARFSNDDTGNRGIRVDYLGGVADEHRFFLKMGGFFGNGSSAERSLEITNRGAGPYVDLKKLPNK